MGIFSRSPRNVKKTKVLVVPFPSEDSLLDKPPVLSKEQLMYKALLKMNGRRKFRAAVNAVRFSNNICDHIESRRRNIRKLRASVRCINFVHMLEQRQAARKKFRAAVKATELVNNLSNRIVARRKFREAVNVLILSDRVVDRPLSSHFGIATFQDSVNLLVAFNQLERPFASPILKQEHDQLVKQNEAPSVGPGGGEAGGRPVDEPMVLHGKLVHQSRDFTTIWKFVEQEEEQDKVPPNSE